MTLDPQLHWTQDGEPRSGRFNDVYFSRDDGLSESRAVFLDGCGLPQAWADRPHFTVAELGFGTGLNLVAVMALWKHSRPPGARLSLFSIEAYPLQAEDARRALAAWPELAEAAAPLLAAWPFATPGFHRVDLPDDVTLDLAVADVRTALDRWTGRADAWFLDGFSPALNPDMWSDEVFDRIAARSAPDARVATFTVAGAVRRALAERGFTVEKRPGHGRKRERLEARGSTPPAPALPLPSVCVIGAGIAGAALSRAFAAAGVPVTLIEAEGAGGGASGFPAALVTPRFDVGDAVVAGFYAQALSRARTLYDATPEAIIQTGVLQLEQAPRDARRFPRIAEQPIWAPGAMRLLSSDEASERAGEPVQVAALAMSEALCVRPSAILEHWTTQADVRTGRAAALKRDGGDWTVLNDQGEILARASIVVIAAGWGTAALLDSFGGAPLRPVRGQADWTASVQRPAMAWGGYVAPIGNGLLFGATHDRDDVDVTVRAGDSARNLAAVAARLPHLAETLAAQPREARAAVRATTPDRLPLAGAWNEKQGLFVLSGLGSRGFCVAPLLAEHLAAVALGRPSPLPVDAAMRLAASRFNTPELAQSPARTDAEV